MSSTSSSTMTSRSIRRGGHASYNLRDPVAFKAGQSLIAKNNAEEGLVRFDDLFTAHYDDELDDQDWEASETMTMSDTDSDDDSDDEELMDDDDDDDDDGDDWFDDDSDSRLVFFRYMNIKAKAMQKTLGVDLDFKRGLVQDDDDDDDDFVPDYFEMIGDIDDDEFMEHFMESTFGLKAGTFMHHQHFYRPFKNSEKGDDFIVDDVEEFEEMSFRQQLKTAKRWCNSPCFKDGDVGVCKNGKRITGTELLTLIDQALEATF